MKANGLKENELAIGEATVRDVIRYYTRESGVRNLEREIAKICRKVVKALLLRPHDRQTQILAKSLEKYLGVRRFRYGRAEENDQVGQVTGLAWTEVGGELLTIEAAVVPGKGKLIHTGQLGEVMQESIQAATTVVRSRATVLGIERGFPSAFRSAHTRAGGRHAQGWAERGRRHVHSAGVGADRHSGPVRCRHDRGDHACVGRYCP